MVDTVTATPSPTSTSYYDDGMWHTYYPIKPQESIFADYKQAAAASAAPTAFPQFNHSVSTLPSSTFAEIVPRQLLATGVAAAVKPREAVAGTAAEVYARAEPTGVVNEKRAAPSGFVYERRAVPSGTIAEELVDREVEAGSIVALDQRAAATGAPIARRAAGTAAVIEQRAAGTGILIDERAAPSAAPLTVRVAPAPYKVVSWNETTSA